MHQIIFFFCKKLLNALHFLKNKPKIKKSNEFHFTLTIGQRKNRTKKKKSRMDVKWNRERADRRMNWAEFRAHEVIFLNCAPHRNAIEVYRWFRAIAVTQQRCDVSYNRNVYYNTHANCFALLISSTANSLTLFLSLAAVSVLSRSCVGAPILLSYFFILLFFFC